MKKKIGIITIYDCVNFGNRLQNYALYRVISEHLNCKCVTLVSQEGTLSISNLKSLLYEYLATTPVKKILSQHPVDQKYWKFREFTRKHIPTKFYRGSYKLPYGLANEFDFFVAGSDQIWNYLLPGRFQSFEKHSWDYFLEFANYDQRVSYAASFGISKIPDDKRAMYTKRLCGFKYLSIREEEGAELVKSLTGKDVAVHIDPTMLLSSEEYKKVITTPEYRKKNQKKYILEYFLGGINHTRRELIDNLAKENDWSKVDLLDSTQIQYFVSSPSDFLYWIKNAEMICTDSFHAVVFSIIFQCPFVVFSRNDGLHMNSRIITLLSGFGFLDRLFNGKDLNEYKYCNFEKTEEILIQKREIALRYLRSSLLLDS